MQNEYYKQYFHLEKNHWVFVGRRNIAISILEEYIDRRRDLKVLDVGTGTGVMLGVLGRYGDVTGLDNNNEAINFCHARGYYNVVKGEANALPFPDDSFDLVCAMDLLEHLDDDAGALEEFYRVLHPGGLLFITIPAYQFLWGPHDLINMHRRRYRISGIARIVSHSGFRVERVSYFNFFFFPVIAFIRLTRRALYGRRFKPKSDLYLLPPVLDAALEKVFSFEKILLRYLNFPFGVSILCVGRKP